MIPNSVKLSSDKRSLQIEYDKKNFLILSSSFLRAHTPSVENKNNLNSPDIKRFSEVLIKKVEKVGNYAVRISFTDGHNTGIYSWDFLYEIGLKSQTA
ncbi:MAG: hypothetical protein CMM98_03975 [Rickettsiales bacterium]|nr:hypothetical protein [Rickettsiales bacterium]|tara:strand:- start:812 stop:1105 length:294 start_codon:yes stop_codon:yes gene_type:complete